MKRLSKDQKIEFINSHMSFVPEKRIDVFMTLDVERQYKRIREYVRKQNHKDSPKQRTINEILSAYLKTKNAKLDVVEKLMEKCQKWIDETYIRKTTELEKQISKLQTELAKYNRHKPSQN